MKRTMIALLACAVLLSLASCERRSTTPARSEGEIVANVEKGVDPGSFYFPPEWAPDRVHVVDSKKRLMDRGIEVILESVEALRWQQYSGQRQRYTFLVLHVPHPWEALIRYYGAAASTTRRGEETQQEPLLEEGEGEYKSKSKRSCARLIKKHFGRDPLTCPKCGEAMEVIALIKDEQVIEKILKHLQIWDPPTGPPFDPEVKETVYDYTFFDDVPPDELTD